MNTEEVNFIQGTLQTLNKAINFKDADTQEMETNMESVRNHLLSVMQSRLMNDNGDAIIGAFLKGKPIVYLKRLIQWRKAGNFDLDDKHRHISMVYRWLIASFVNITCVETGCEYYLNNEGIKYTCFELKSNSFLEKLDISKNESLTLTIAGFLLTIINNISRIEGFKLKLTEELQKQNFIEVLMLYIDSLYAVINLCPLENCKNKRFK